MSMHQRRKGSASIIIIILLLCVIIGLVIWYAFWGKPKAQKVQSPNSSPVATKSQDPYANWKTLESKYEKISFKYPADWRFTDLSSDNGAQTVKDEKIPGPYEHFYLTAPSGLVMEYQTHIMGLGGSCFKKGESDKPEELCPDVETVDATAIKAVPGLYIVGTEIRDTTSKLVMSRSLSWISTVGSVKVPKVGTEQNVYPYYPLFHVGGTAKFTDGQVYPSTMKITTNLPYPTLLPTKPEDNKLLMRNLSTAQFFQQADWVTARKILESAQPL